MDFTVDLRQSSASMSATITSATFTIDGGICHAQFHLVAGAAGTLGAEINLTAVGLPAPLASATREPHGLFFYNDIGTNGYIGAAQWDGSVIRLQCTGSTSRLGGTPAFAVASSDTLSVYLSFPIA